MRKSRQKTAQLLMRLKLGPFLGLADDTAYRETWKAVRDAVGDDPLNPFVESLIEELAVLRAWIVRHRSVTNHRPDCFGEQYGLVCEGCEAAAWKAEMEAEDE